MKCYLNGKILPQAEANVGLTDLALIRGFGIFDYFVFEDFKPRFLPDYLDRFYNSAQLLGLHPRVAKEELRTAVHDLIRANDVPTGGIRLVLTGGYADDCYTPTEGNQFILQGPFPNSYPERFVRGARVATYQHQREMAAVKSINYVTGIHILPWLREQAAEYVVYHDGTYLRESDRSNFFIVTADGELATAAAHVLGGITRKKILQLARERGLRVAEREVALAELWTAREAFLTSSTKGAMPVTLVDGKAIGDGVPGPVVQQLQAAFLALVQAEQHATR
ncbi:MAG: aminotransferase class IV [Bacteroidota bacterium]